jgi:hypothetical protein
LTQFINTQTLEVALRYHNIDNLRLVHSLTQKQYDKACKLLSSEIKVQLNRNIRPLNGKLRSLFDNSLASMTNIIQEEEQRLESDAKDIIDKDYVTFISGEDEIKKDLVTIWCKMKHDYYLVSVNQLWDQLYCFCKISPSLNFINIIRTLK